MEAPALGRAFAGLPGPLQPIVPLEDAQVRLLAPLACVACCGAGLQWRLLLATNRTARMPPPLLPRLARPSCCNNPHLSPWCARPPVQVQSFIDDGFLVVEPPLSRSFHERLLKKAEALRRNAEDLRWQGNDCFPVNPLLGEVLSDPHVHGALTGLMGPGYALHPHRHCHTSDPGNVPQTQHQDCQDDCYVRSNKPRWCMALCELLYKCHTQKRIFH